MTKYKVIKNMTKLKAKKKDFNHGQFSWITK